MYTVLYTGPYQLYFNFKKFLENAFEEKQGTWNYSEKEDTETNKQWTDNIFTLCTSNP